MTISEYQKTVDRWISSTDSGYFSPLTNMAMLCEETGEVARVMARTYGDQKAKEGETLKLADELADVVWIVAAIANQTGIDLTDAIEANIKKKNSRDRERFNKE